MAAGYIVRDDRGRETPVLKRTERAARQAFVRRESEGNKRFGLPVAVIVAMWEIGTPRPIEQQNAKGHLP